MRDVSEEPSQTPALIRDHRSHEKDLKNLERRNILECSYMEERMVRRHHVLFNFVETRQMKLRNVSVY